MANGEAAVVTSVAGSIGTWTFRTAMIAFFLALMGAVYYLYTTNNTLHDQITASKVEAAECKARLDILRDFRK